MDCRVGVTTSQRLQQLAIITDCLRCSEPITGPLFHRLVRIQNQSPTPNLLQLETRSRCNIMAGWVTISGPTILPEHYTEDPERVSESGLPDFPSMARSGMVFSVASNADRLPHFSTSISRNAPECRAEASSIASRGEVIPDHLACLRQSYKMQGFSGRIPHTILEKCHKLLIQFSLA